MQTSTNHETLIVKPQGNGLSTRTFATDEDVLEAYLYMVLSKEADDKEKLKAKKTELMALVSSSFDQAFKDYHLYECDWCGGSYDGDDISGDFCSEICETKYQNDINK